MSEIRDAAGTPASRARDLQDAVNATKSTSNEPARLTYIVHCTKCGELATPFENEVLAGQFGNDHMKAIHGVS